MYLPVRSLVINFAVTLACASLLSEATYAQLHAAVGANGSVVYEDDLGDLPEGDVWDYDTSQAGTPYWGGFTILDGVTEVIDVTFLQPANSDLPEFVLTGQHTPGVAWMTPTGESTSHLWAEWGNLYNGFFEPVAFHHVYLTGSSATVFGGTDWDLGDTVLSLAGRHDYAEYNYLRADRFVPAGWLVMNLGKHFARGFV